MSRIGEAKKRSRSSTDEKTPGRTVPPSGNPVSSGLLLLPVPSTLDALVLPGVPNDNDGNVLEMTAALWTLRGTPEFAAAVVNRPVAVHLARCGVTQEGVDTILSTMRLTALDVTSCRIITSIRAINGHHLKSLKLIDVYLEQAAIDGVEAPLLEELGIGCPGIHDVSTLLRDCRTLKTLSLIGTGITPASKACGRRYSRSYR